MSEQKSFARDSLIFRPLEKSCQPCYAQSIRLDSFQTVRTLCYIVHPKNHLAAHEAHFAAV